MLALLDLSAFFFVSGQENNPHLEALKRSGGTVCELIKGHLYLDQNDLGAIADMPLSMGGCASYNVANLAAAACIALSLGVDVAAIKVTMKNFGALNSDNPGRLQRWSVGGVNVLSDYAHNPEGLQGFLSIAHVLRQQGRLALLLGQAGNREEKDIRALAEVAASFNPDLIVLKDIDGFMRGREAGEVAAILQDALIKRGIAQDRISIQLDEVDAVRTILAWSKAGDILALPIHSTAGRAEVETLMQIFSESSLSAGESLPARTEKTE